MARKREPVRTQREKAHHRFLGNPFVLRLYPFVILTVLGIVIYSNSFDCSFHFDDYSNIENNESIRNIRDLKAIWNFSYHSKMRFLGFLTFALDYQFHQYSLLGYHLVNLAIHITASFLVWWLVVLILSTPAMRDHDIGSHKKLAALWCALIFLTHPVQTQAVTYIVQRFASLASMLYLLSLCLYLKARMTATAAKAALFFSLAVVSAMAGFFTKEIALTLPLAILLFEFGFIKDGTRINADSADLHRFKLKLKDIIRGYPLYPRKSAFNYMVHRKSLILGALFILIGFVIPAILLYRSVNVFQIFIPVTSDNFQDPPLTSLVYLMTQFTVIVRYIRLLLVPVGLNFDHDIQASASFFAPATFLSFILLASIFIGAVLLFKIQNSKFKIQNSKFIAAGVLFFFLTLSIESSIKPLKNVMTEHRLYLPVVGFSMVVVGILYALLRRRFHQETGVRNDKAEGRRQKAEGKKTLLTYIFSLPLCHFATLSLIVLIGTYSILTYERNTVWKNDFTLWSDAAKKSPNKVRTLYNLGAAYNKAGMTGEGVRKCQEALKIALRIKPDYADAYATLAYTYYIQGNVDEAISLYRETLRLDPSNIEALINLGNIYFSQGKVMEAFEQFNNAVYYRPNLPVAQNNLGNMYLHLGNIDNAIAHLAMAVTYDSTYAQAYYNLGRALQARGNINEAEASFKKAFRLDPELKKIK